MCFPPLRKPVIIARFQQSKSFSLLILFALVIQTYSQFGLLSHAPGECVLAGDIVNLTCTVYDTGDQGITSWTGNYSIFDCPDEDSIADRRVYLFHIHFNNSRVVDKPTICTDRVFGKIISYNSTHYVSVLTVITTPAMNGGLIFCHDLFTPDAFSGEVKLKVGVRPNPPLSFNVTFLKTDQGREFRVMWSEPNNTVGGIGSYLMEVNGSECGVCKNIGNVTGNELSCYNWTASGQVCNVLVWSVSADCGYESEEPAIFKIHLQTPDAPIFKIVSPLYSAELKSITVSLEPAEGLHDEYGLPVTYWVHIEDVLSGSTCVKLAHSCAPNRCEVTIDLGGDCQFDGANDSGHFSVSAFASTIIGKSLTTYPNEIHSVNNLVELNVLMEQEYSLMVAEFVDAFTNLSIQYGDTCDALMFEKRAFTEPKDFTNCMALYNIQLSDCFVATLSADNGSFAIHIRGHFHDYEKTSDHRILISVGVTLMLSVTFNLVLIICVVTLLRRAKQVIPITESTEPANHRVPNPVYEEIDEIQFVNATTSSTFEPDTIQNACYQIKPEPKTGRNGCYHHVLDPPTAGSACYQPSTREISSHQ